MSRPSKRRRRWKARSRACSARAVPWAWRSEQVLLELQPFDRMVAALIEPELMARQE